jgi:dehydrogenase/reductase SDR family protein 1
LANELKGRVAIVTGASRGIGKGIAEALGAAGATVYVTGRTVTTEGAPLPGTVGETAELVTKLGGSGIAVQCDHANDEEVAALFRQVAERSGRLDLLVNNAATLPPELHSGLPFWEMPNSVWDSLIDVGLRSNYVATVLAAPMMIAQGGGLIVNVSSRGAGGYSFTPAYGVGKAGVDRLTADTAHELREQNVAVVSLWPGLVRTEGVVADAEHLHAQYGMTLDRAQSPRFVGNAVAALAADAAVMARSGSVVTVSALAREYGFSDPG